MKTLVQQGSPAKNPYPNTVLNASGERIPARACMQISSASLVGSDTVYTVVRPNGTQNARYLLNSPSAVAISGFGAGTIAAEPADAAYNTASAPAVNAEWGPVVGSWLLSINGKGFTILGGASSGVVRVAAKGGTSAGDDFPLIKIGNISGLAKAFGSVVGFGQPFDPPPSTLGKIHTFASAAPVAGRPFVVLFGDVAAGGIGDAAQVGVVSVQIDFTNENHTRARVIPNDYGKLASDVVGSARIVKRERESVLGSGTLGVQWAQVELNCAEPNAIEFSGVSEATIPAAIATRTGLVWKPGPGPFRMFIKPVSGPPGTDCPKSSVLDHAENWAIEPIQVYKPLIAVPSRWAPDGKMIYKVTTEMCKELPSE